MSSLFGCSDKIENPTDPIPAPGSGPVTGPAPGSNPAPGPIVVLNARMATERTLLADGQDYTVRYEFNATNQLIATVLYRTPDPNAVIYRNTLTYNDNKQLIRNEQRSGPATKADYDARYTYDYAPNGQLTRRVTASPASGQVLVIDSMFYNARNWVQRLQADYYTGNTVYLRFTEVNDFDGSGNVTGQIETLLYYNLVQRSSRRKLIFFYDIAPNPYYKLGFVPGADGQTELVNSPHNIVQTNSWDTSNMTTDFDRLSLTMQETGFGYQYQGGRPTKRYNASDRSNKEFRYETY
jgi:hypothetical protein